MAEEKKDSSRHLLAEIEGAWDSPRPGEVTAASVQPPSPEMQAVLDAHADRLVDSLDPPPVSVPSMDELDQLDSGWGEDDDDDDEDDEPEPELPDERLDPVAYAEAKKARDARIEARRERRRVKAEAKKARRKARAEAVKAKQKPKTKKARPPAAAKAAKAEARAADLQRRRAVPKPSVGAEEQDDSDDEDEDEIIAAGVPSRARAKAPPSRVKPKGMLSTTNQWMLAVAILVFVAAAIFAAVVAR